VVDFESIHSFGADEEKCTVEERIFVSDQLTTSNWKMDSSKNKGKLMQASSYTSN
jgi:hypothetical protein